MKLPTLILLPLALSVAGAAIAAPGALEINADCVVVGCFTGDSPGYPVTISQPGTYVLTSDLVPPDSGKNAIEISVSLPVDLDLGGHTIDGGASCTGTPVTTCTSGTGGNAINAQSTPPATMHVHNGTARGFITAIALFDAEDGTVFDHLTITQNSNQGLFFTSNAGSTVRVRDSQVTRNGNQGIFASSAVILENSSIVGNKTAGVAAGSANSIFVGNRFALNGARAIDCTLGPVGQTCALGQNTFAGNNVGGADQYKVGQLRDMGGNVCLDYAGGTCP